SIAEKLRLRRVTEQSIVGIPGTSQDLDAVFKHMLSDDNIEPLAKIGSGKSRFGNNTQIGLINLLRAVSVKRRRDDLPGFALDLYRGFLTLSVADGGYRSQQLTAIASGFIAAMKDLQKYEAQTGVGKSDLEKRGLL
ncbi:MAG: hypothetical protein H7836_13145, partial [Magnetococcus sp. YQC-3]